jgi:hypothetical protein
VTSGKVTRRGALAAALATTLASCGSADDTSTLISLPPRAPQAPGSELLSMRQLLLAERLQQARWAAAATAATSPRVRRALEREAAVEEQHVQAIEELVISLGGTADPFTPGPIPVQPAAALRDLRRIEQTVAGAWRGAASGFVARETRAAALSLLGTEIRQLGVLDTLLGTSPLPVAPPPLAIDDAIVRLGPDLGTVPRG